MNCRAYQGAHNGKGALYEMAGQIKTIIDSIIEKRSTGNPIVAGATRTKLILKGLHPDRFNRESADDPVVIEKLRSVAIELGVQL